MAWVEVGGGEFVYKVIQTSRLYEQIVQQIEESILQGRTERRQPAARGARPRQAIRRQQNRRSRSHQSASGKGTGRRYSGPRNLRHEWHLKFHAPVAGPDYQERRTGWLASTWWKFGQILEPEIAALAAVRADDQDLGSDAGSCRSDGQFAHGIPTLLSKRILIFTWRSPRRRRTRLFFR